MIQLHDKVQELLDIRGFSVYYHPPTYIIPGGLNTWSTNGHEMAAKHKIDAAIHYPSSTNPWGYKVEGQEKIVAGYYCNDEEKYLWILPDYSTVILSEQEMIQRLNLLIFL